MKDEEISNDFELVSLQKDNSFFDFEEAENHVRKFAEYKDFEDEEISNDFEPVLLQKGNSFSDFKEAENYVCKFAKYKGFGICLGHVIAINNAEGERIICKYTINYKHSGVYKPKNLEKLGTSIQQICEWYMNLSCPKNSSRIIVTTLKNEHNHDISPEAMQFKKK
ncbi:24644_t:CDS:2 [Racocetra persica]|uniref:24644_t:CDS:1 n=1 Tax=Racocetra persica TaxID=160502 RepID=A0ACA9PJ54_9GLOM|nr:24644_t:CDS:2 [Racocetra persica]